MNDCDANMRTNSQETEQEIEMVKDQTTGAWRMAHLDGSHGDAHVAPVGDIWDIRLIDVIVFLSLIVVLFFAGFMAWS